MERADLLTILDTGDFDLLIGQMETDWLDCKRDIYPTSNGDKGKRELAKDISSFANTKDGGYILIGIETEKREQQHTDTIKAIHPISQNTIDVEQYYNIIKEWVYPLPEIKIEWKKYREADKGIIVINVSPQKDAIKPFLITKTTDDSGKRIEILFGYAERKRANSEPKKIAELHQLVRDGLSYGTTLSNRFDEISTLLKELSTTSSMIHRESVKIESPANITVQPPIKKEQIDTEIWEKIGEAIGVCELTGHRMFILTGFTSEQVSIPAWIDSSADVVKALENPSELRYGGWNLNTGGNRSHIIRGELRRVVAQQHKILDLYRDGTTVFAVSAESDFLAWGREQSDLKINSLALIETIYNFTAFYGVVINNFDLKPSEIFIRIDFHNMHLKGEKTFMVPYAVGAFSRPPYQSPNDTWNKTLKFEVENFDVSIVAYQIVQEIYLWFGMDIEMIPYVSDKNGQKIIDCEQIKNIKS